jgi:hypothetical protein
MYQSRPATKVTDISKLLNLFHLKCHANEGLHRVGRNVVIENHQALGIDLVPPVSCEVKPRTQERAVAMPRKRAKLIPII